MSDVVIERFNGGLVVVRAEDILSVEEIDLRPEDGRALCGGWHVSLVHLRRQPSILTDSPADHVVGAWDSALQEMHTSEDTHMSYKVPEELPA